MSLDKEFETIAENFKNKAGSDYAASRGEYLNGIVMSAYYRDSPLWIPQRLIRFNENGDFDAETTDRAAESKSWQRCQRQLSRDSTELMKMAMIKTFSRGGSDITGSIVARAVEADLYENWTDVSGFLVTDPRLIENPETIDVITYRELKRTFLHGGNSSS